MKKVAKKIRIELARELNRNLRCSEVYPKPTKNEKRRNRKTIKKTIGETVGFKLEGEQIVKLAGRLLMAYDRGLRELDLTTFRNRTRKSDGTHLMWLSNKGRRFGRENLIS